MPKLIYWVAPHRHDHACYSIIAKTKREVLRTVEENGADNYEEPEKRVIVYKDAFDLFEKTTGEGDSRDNAGMPWETYRRLYPR